MARLEPEPGGGREGRWLSADELAAWRGLMRMQAQLGALLNRELTAATDLSLQDYGVLVALAEQPEGRLRAYELGRELGWEKSRLSHHVARMEGRGLVERRRCPSDQRGMYIGMTERGRQALEAAAPDHVAQVRRAFVDLLTPEQLATLTEITEAVIETLGAQCAAEDSQQDGTP
jgi:DNA-binding MarR family transcriptional regulator